MKNILIITEFIAVPGKNTNSRFRYLTNMLVERNINVEIVTTNFSHTEKKHRFFDKDKVKCNYGFTMLDEPGYKKNVSLKRIYSHYIFSRNLKKYLKNIKNKPDIVYCAVPSLDSAKVAAKFCENNNIRFIIDIQDLWPEAFKMVFNIPIISNIIFFPMKKKADYIYKSADDIIAVSDTYVDRATKVNKKYKNKLTVYLGTDLDKFDACKEEKYNETESSKNIKVVYVGTLGHSYDLETVIGALKILSDSGIKNIEFIVMGDGPLKEKFESYANEKNVKCKFLGRLPYEGMVKKLCTCDIAINPIRNSSAASIINKVGDYAAAGLPVINTQESREYRKLVEQYDIGLNCENGNPEDLAEKLKILIDDEKLRKLKGKNNRKLAEEKFDRKCTYKKIVELIKDVM